MRLLAFAARHEPCWVREEKSMNCRSMFRFAAIGGALAVLARGAGAEEAKKKQHKIVLHVGANDQELHEDRARQRQERL